MTLYRLYWGGSKIRQRFRLKWLSYIIAFTKYKMGAGVFVLVFTTERDARNVFRASRLKTKALLLRIS